MWGKLDTTRQYPTELDERSRMSETSPRAYILFTGTGPILLLSTYPSLDDERLITRLRYKGIERALAYEVTPSAVETRYPDTYPAVAGELEGQEDLRVLDFNGHQIMGNFALDELGDPIRIG
jgi:hypothetical protein